MRRSSQPREDRRRVAALLAVAAWALGSWSLAAAGEAGSEIEDFGRELYLRHCAACHGSDGTGGGPAAAALKTAPSDLTRISQRHDGKFPDREVRRVIDGERPFAAHGSRDMPIWGREFRDLHGERETKARLFALGGYLKSIQAK